MKHYQLLLSFATLCTGLLWGAPAAQSAAVNLDIPYTAEEFAEQWTIIPTENSEGTWTYQPDSPTAYPHAMSGDAANADGATLVSPGIEAKSGRNYYIKVQVKTTNSTQNFDILLGYDPANLEVWRSTSISAKYASWLPTSTAQQTYTATEDGTLYVGIRPTKNSSAGNLCVFKVSYEALIDVPGACKNVKAVTDSEGKTAATLTWEWPTQSAYNNPLDGIDGARIYRHTSSISKFTDDYLIATVEGGTPGESATFTDTTVPEPGEYYYYVRAFNSEGEATTGSYARTWVGEDEKVLNPLNAVATPAGDNVELTFTPRYEPYHTGAWIDASQIKFRITRRNGTDASTAVTLTDDFDASQLPFVDTTLPGAGTYTYYVEAMYKGTPSTSLTSNSVFGGGALTLPYTDDFSDTSKFSTYTIVGSSTSYAWNRSYSGYVQFSAYSSYSSTLVTPPFDLEAGHNYRIAVLSWVDESSGGWYDDPEIQPRDLTFTVGKTANSQTDIKKITIDKTKSDATTVEAFFTPEESGRYMFGLFSQGVSYSYKIYVDDLLIEEAVTKPAEVTDITVTPDADGALSATVAFTAPSTTNSGTALDAFSKIEVTRTAAGENESVTVKTITDATPGAAIEFTDEVPAENAYQYTVVTYIGETPSNPASSQSKWVGFDIPKPISSFNLSYSLNDEGVPAIKWQASSGVQHNGVVAKEGLKYRVLRIPGNEEVALTAELEALDTEAATIAYGRYKYQITVVNGTMESTPVEGYSKLTLGDAVALPYEPDFTDEAHFECWDGRGWIMDTDNTFTLKYKYELGEEPYTAYAPPFRGVADGKTSYKLTLGHSRMNAEYEELVNVYLCTIETSDADENQQPARAAIAGADNRTLIEQLAVTADHYTPATRDMVFQLPANGKYRLAFECVSPYNYGVSLHSLKLEPTSTSAIDSVKAATGLRYDSVTATLTLPENACLTELFSVSGMLVRTTTATDIVSLGDLTDGIYIARVTCANGTSATLRIAKH